MNVGAFAAPRGGGLRGWLARRRLALAGSLAFLNAAAGMPDDRQLLLPCGATNIPEANSFASPAFPALSAGTGDTALVGSVVSSHSTIPSAGDGANALWAIWNGGLKAFRLDSRGFIPVAGASTAAPASAAAWGFAVWNAGRVLGYTDPVTIPSSGAAPAAPLYGAGNAGAITVWPGRRMFWGDGTGPAVPLPRKEFQPNTGDCAGTHSPGDCFYDLMTAMGLDPTVSADVTKAVRTVNFLRGGKTTTGSRDEVLSELGAANPGTYGTVSPGTIYSYRYQDDVPPGNAAGAPTEQSPPAYYSHKLGDILHSEPVVLPPPRYFQYVSSNLTPRSGACGNLADCSYGTFRAFHRFRRHVAFVGSNDGFLHAFDAGVFDRDDGAGEPFDDAFDLGTGREIFAFAPKIMKANGGKGFPNLLDFPPKPQYFVDGSPVLADVFIDTQHNGTPNAANRTWKTVLVSGLGRGGRSYFALDVTQPDVVGADGKKTAGKDTFPDCIDAPENGDGNCAARYPMILWELTDDCTPGSRGCVSPIGETWSRPVLGRIRVTDGSTAIRDRYVAIFGGGFDPTFVPGAEIDPNDNATRGRAIYIVNLETGTVIYKATMGQDADGNDVLFAPVPASPAVADVDDDGYLDVAYFGDLNGRMWRLDLRSGRCSTSSATDSLTELQPFLLYDGMSANNAQKVQPVFLDAGLIFISGGPTPVLGVAWGTGYRAELLSENPNVHRFLLVVDEGDQATTFDETSLVNITPEGGETPVGRDRTCDAAPCGYFLDFASAMEKAVSSVFSTFGKLSLVAFRPKDANELCGSGLSARYGFDYKTGVGTYGTSVKVSSYKEELGEGLASPAQSQGSTGLVIDSVVYSTGSVKQKTAGGLTTLNNNWKEQ